MKTFLLFLTLSLSVTLTWAQLKPDSTVLFNADGTYREKTLYSYNTVEGDRVAFGYVFQNGAWENQMKTVTNTIDKMQESITSLWKNGGWTLSSKSEYVFSDDKSLTDSYIWNGSDWSLDHQYHYYFNGEMLLSYFSPTTGLPTLYLETLYDEHENKLVTTALNYNSTTGEKESESITEIWRDDYGNQTGHRNIEFNKYYTSWTNNTHGTAYWRKSFDSKGNMLEELNYTWLDKEQDWEESTRKLCTFDSNSNKTSETQYRWDNSKKSWIAHSKWERTYDRKSNLTSEIGYYFDEYNTHKLNYNGKTEYTYDANNYETSVISYIWMFDQWVSTYKRERARDARGNVLSDTRYKFEYGEWIVNEEPITYEYTYDKNGNAIIRYETSEGRLFEKTEYAYDSYNNRIMEATYGKDEKTDQWHKFDKKEWKYNAKNQLIEERVYDGERTNEWIFNEKTTYEYDNDGNLAKETSYRWIDKIIMMPVISSEYEYHATGEKLRETCIRYDRGAASNISVYEYDRDGNILYSSFAYLENGRWQGDYISKHLEEFDDNNRPVLNSSYEWRNGAWMCTQSYIAEYDSFGHQTLSLSSYYNPESGELMSENKTENFYDSKGRSTGSQNTQTNNGTIVQGQKNTITYDSEYLSGKLIKEIQTSTYFNWGTNGWTTDYYTCEYLSDAPTGIEEIEAESRVRTPVKVFHNGSFYIVGHDGIYNVSGIRM